MAHRTKVSTTIIACDEERTIGDCIRSVLPFSDEVLVVDSMSSDRTREVARRLGARVVVRRFLGYVRQKDFAVRSAKHDMVFCIDADERATPELAAKVLRLKRDGFGHDAYTVNRRNHYLGRWLRHGGWYPDRKIRLFDRRKARWTGEDPHDRVRPDPGARVAHLGADLVHLTYPTLASHLAQIARFSTIAAARKEEAGVRGERWRMVFEPGWTFFRRFWLQAGFLDGLRGLCAARLSAVSDFMKYAMLWERRLGRKEGRRDR